MPSGTVTGRLRGLVVGGRVSLGVVSVGVESPASTGLVVAGRGRAGADGAVIRGGMVVAPAVGLPLQSTPSLGRYEARVMSVTGGRPSTKVRNRVVCTMVHWSRGSLVWSTISPVTNLVEYRSTVMVRSVYVGHIKMPYGVMFFTLRSGLGYDSVASRPYG